MSSKLYVGNIAFQTREEDLEQVFSDCGNVVSVKIIVDRESGRSRGFGFVEMGSANEANESIEKLNGQEVNGRELRVSLAQERENRDRRSAGSRNNFQKRRW